MLQDQVIRFLAAIAPALIFIGLLFGPTLAYFLLRAFLGRDSEDRRGYLALTEPPHAEPLEDLLDRGALWLCVNCRSLNVDAASRCYRCGIKRPVPLPIGAAAEFDSATMLQRIGVPVMAAEARQHRQTMAVPISTNGSGHGKTNGVLPPRDAEPLTEPPAAPAAAPAASSSPKSRGRRTANPAPARGEDPWCPLLGIRGNTKTVYSWAHPEHRCHAGAKPAPIDAEHQQAFCLTNAYPACPIYVEWASRVAKDEASGAATPAVRRR